MNVAGRVKGSIFDGDKDGKELIHTNQGQIQRHWICK